MKTLSVSISDVDYNKFGLTQEQLSFKDILNLVSKELMRQNLNKSVELADKYGLSKMTMDEISDEVKGMRKDAKNRS